MIRQRWITRICACLAIACSAAADDAAELNRILESRDVQEKLRAVEGLGTEKASAAEIKVLAAKLSDADVGVRVAAVRALAKMGPVAKSAKGDLLQRLSDDEFGDDGEPVWYASAVALGKIDPEMIPEIRNWLKQDDVRMQVIAATVIHEIGPTAKDVLPIVLELVKNDDSRVRISMIYALMGLKSEAAPAVPQLLALLRHEDFHTRYWTCRAIGRIGLPITQPAVPILVELLEDETPSVRGNAAASLGKLGPAVATVATEPLRKALNDKLYNVRVSTSIALGELGPAAKDAAPALEACLTRQGFSARSQAAVALWRITNRPQPSVDVLLAEIQHPDSPWDAAEGFQIMGGAAVEAVNRLVEISRSDNPETRVFAAQALGGIGASAKNALPRLQELRNDPDEGVREVAAQSIQVIDPLAKAPNK